MTDLVTDAAELAAAHVMDDPHQIEIALRAAAPFIAAEALRQAAEKFRADCVSAEQAAPEAWNYVCTCPYDSLMAMVRMLELDAELERSK